MSNPLLSLLGSRVVAYRLALVKPAGGPLEALFLSQACYWQSLGDPEAWWSRTREEWEADTGMTRRHQETARKRLKERGLIEERREGIPPTIHTRVCVESLRKSLGFQKGATSPNVRAQPAPTNGRIPPSHHHKNKEEKTDADLAIGLSQENLFEAEPTPFPLPATPPASACFEDWWKHVDRKHDKKSARTAWAKVVASHDMVAEVAAVSPEERERVKGLHVNGVTALLIHRRQAWEQIMGADWGYSGPPSRIWPQGWLNKGRWQRGELEALEAMRRERASPDRRRDETTGPPPPPRLSPEAEAERQRLEERRRRRAEWAAEQRAKRESAQERARDA